VNVAPGFFISMDEPDHALLRRILCRTYADREVFQLKSKVLIDLTSTLDEANAARDGIMNYRLRLLE
jgi:hypothetical protein